jgi:hypothetical protein
MTSTLRHLDNFRNFDRDLAKLFYFMVIFLASKNNGITEGFHRKMKLIQRRAYGFKNFENYRLRVKVLCR